MLKIKDNVDLKELEKYGFELNEYGQYSTANVVIFKKNRKISGRTLTSSYSKLYAVYDLFDLIKDGLVEKVEEEE